MTAVIDAPVVAEVSAEASIPTTETPVAEVVAATEGTTALVTEGLVTVADAKPKEKKTKAPKAKKAKKAKVPGRAEHGFELVFPETPFTKTELVSTVKNGKYVTINMRIEKALDGGAIRKIGNMSVAGARGRPASVFVKADTSTETIATFEAAMKEKGVKYVSL